MDQENLIAFIQSYCAEHGYSPTGFGKKFMGDPKFVSDLMDGRELRNSTLRKLLADMEAGERSEAA